MIKFNFNQTGGYPLTTETLDRLQSAYGIVENVARMAGNFAIISGCEVSGTQILSGTVMINGELLEFRGGIVQPTVFIGTEKRQETFENGDVRPVETLRYCAFGTGSEQFVWTNFKRVAPLNLIDARISKMEKLMSPLLDGGILLWNKPANTIPAGWQEVTEFRGRMPFGWNPDDGDFDTVGKTGGAKEHTLSEPEMPSHSHSTAPFNKFVAKAGDLGQGNYTVGSSTDYTPSEVAIGGLSASQMSQMVETAKGGGMAHDNMSPYRIVMFIKYVG